MTRSLPKNQPRFPAPPPRPCSGSSAAFPPPPALVNGSLNYSHRLRGLCSSERGGARRGLRSRWVSGPLLCHGNDSDGTDACNGQERSQVCISAHPDTFLSSFPRGRGPKQKPTSPYRRWRRLYNAATARGERPGVQLFGIPNTRTHNLSAQE